MLEQKINHPEPDLVHCPYKRCRCYGEDLNCYFDLYENCEIYLRWDAALRHYIRRAELKDYLKQKRKNRKV